MSKKKQKVASTIPESRRGVEIKCLNKKQKEYVRAIEEKEIIFGIGSAGSGKTMLASLMAVKMFTEGLVDRIIICRPAVQAGGEDIGFLPGGINDKMDPYIQPIFDAFRLYWSVQTIKDHIQNGRIEILPLGFARGRTFHNTVVIADECQNATRDNLLMLLTRLGENSKIIVTGDPVQADIRHSCLKSAQEILGHIDTIEFIHFANRDVVRHPTVEKILNAWPNNGIKEEPATGFGETAPVFLQAVAKG